VPGPGPGIPGYTPGKAAPPKPVTRPWISVPSLATSAPGPLPPDVLSAWRGLWHALGSNLPWYINHSRKSRRALRAFVKTHG